MGTSIPGRRRIREIYDLRAILNAVWNRLTFRVSGSGAEHITVTQTGGNVDIVFDTEGLGGDLGDIGIEDVDGLSDALSALGDEIDGKAPTSHTHDDRYYTETETDSLLAGKAAASHTHDDRYYTESETDSLLAGKAAASHTHNASAIDAGTLDPARLPVAGPTTIGGVKRNPGVAGQYITGFDSDGNAQYDEPASFAYRPGMNMLINGDFSVNQRGTSFTSSGGGNNDGAYTSDRWFVLSDGNDIVDIESSNYRLKLDTETANKKFGIAQIVENRDAEKALGRAVTLSFSANWANGQVQHVKAAILEWTGAVDAPTRDFISAWNADDTLPTLAANWAFLNSPVDLNVTNSSDVYSVSATVGTSAKNLAVLIWSDSTSSTVGNWLLINEVQLEIGGSFTEFQQVPHADQLARCQRYYETLSFGGYGSVALSNQRTASSFHAAWYFHTTKRIAPSVSVVSGTWAGGTPTIQASVDHVDFSRAGAFNLNGTSGNVALAASAEL